MFRQTWLVSGRILGIDPGTRNLGWGVVDWTQDDYRLIGYGLIKTKSATPQPETLSLLYSGIDDLIASYRPHAIAMERVFFSRNARSAMDVAEVRGVIHLLSSQHGLDIASFTPQQVKQAVSSSIKADKAPIQEGVSRALKLPEPVANNHTADALAAALRMAQDYRSR